MPRQFGTQILNSTKKIAKNASCGECQLGDVPVLGPTRKSNAKEKIRCEKHLNLIFEKIQT